DGIRDLIVTGVQTCALPILDSVPVMLAEYAKRRKRIVEGLRGISGVSCEWPGGAFYAFPNISEHLLNGGGKQALAKSDTEIAKRSEERRVGKECSCRWGRGG